MMPVRIEIKWAVIFTLALLAWMYLEKIVGLHDRYIAHHYLYTNLFAIVAIVIYVWALLDKRNNFYAGTITYRQAFVSGLFLTLFITLLSPIAQYIISTIITPAYFDNVVLYTVENNLKTREEALAYFNLENYIYQSVIGSIVMGIVTTAIVAIFIKRS